MGAIHISQWKCGGGEGDVMCDRNFNSADRASHGHIPAGCAKHASPTRRATHASSIEPCRLASAKSSSIPPLHDHHVHECMGTRPTWSCTNNEMLSGYWDINGIGAHCLLDSGCEGVMISPDFIRAMGVIPIDRKSVV